MSPRRARAAAPLLGLALLACAHGPLPGREARRGPAARAAAEDVPVCGHQARVEVAGPGGDGGGGPTLEGELLAASPEALVLLDEAGVHAVQAPAVRRVLVRVRPGHGALIVGLTVLGALSTISNGALLIVTFPLWIAAGVGAGVAGARGDVTEARAGDPALPAYARFPQGLPPGWPPAGARPEPCRPPPTEGGWPRPADEAPPPPAEAAPPPAGPAAAPPPRPEPLPRREGS